MNKHHFIKLNIVVLFLVLFSTNAYSLTPTITSTPITTATVSNLYSYDVEATDPNPAHTLTFSLDVAPAGLTIDTASGLIQWTPTIVQVGNNNITVRVTDNGNLFDTQSFIITVVNNNAAPTITSLPGVTATLGSPYSYDVEATDPNAGDTLTFSLDVAPAGMTIDTASGLIQWTPTIAQVGNNNITVRVTDNGNLFDTQSFIITVVNNNAAPSIISLPGVTATLGSTYSYDVEATDPNAGDTLTFNLDVAPAGLTIDTASGLIQWTPTIAQIGNNNITVRVTDNGDLFDTQSFTVIINKTEKIPTPDLSGILLLIID